MYINKTRLCHQQKNNGAKVKKKVLLYSHHPPHFSYALDLIEICCTFSTFWTRVKNNKQSYQVHQYGSNLHTMDKNTISIVIWYLLYIYFDINYTVHLIFLQLTWYKPNWCHVHTFLWKVLLLLKGYDSLINFLIISKREIEGKR